VTLRHLRYPLVGTLVLAALAPGCSLRGDGQRGSDILFVRERANGGKAIFLMSDDGRDVRRLVAGDWPRWSPDGTRFAYSVRDDSGRPSIWLMNPDSGEKRRIVSPESVSGLAWAPDGLRLAYIDVRRIYVVDTETRDSKPVSLGILDRGLDWSPDGLELLISEPIVKLLSLRTGDERQIAPKVNVDGGRWSPDGERVALSEWNTPYNPRRKAFDIPADGVLTSAIVVADQDGRSRERVTRGAFDSEPAWSGDGKRIYFAREPPARFAEEESASTSEIYVVDLETRSLQRLTNTAVAERSPDPRPADRSLPDPPEPVTGDVVVPDLVGRHVLFDDERRRFRALGMKLKALPHIPELESWLFVIDDQVPLGGSRVPRGTVVKVDASELASLYAHFREEFSPERWKAHPECEGISPRARMYWDLVSRVLRRGMSRERVLSALGEPGRSDRGSGVWPVGQLSVERVDCIYLQVDFDRRGRVTRFYQSTR
jgi:Tol biopolymer transport system component